MTELLPATWAPTLITRSADHRYSLEGKTYPGVTSILDAVLGANFSTAAYYGAKQAAEHVVKLMEEPTVLTTMYMQLGPQGMVPALAGAARKHRDQAAQLGSKVHELAELVAKGASPPTDEPRVQHYLRWWEAAGWKLRTSEAMIVNRAGYGGTFDLLAYDRDGRTVLADIKTGKGIYKEAVLQLHAYEMADVVQVDGKVYPMPAVDRLVILHVTEEGVREVEVPIEAAARQAFYACLSLYEWVETQKGRKL